MILPYKEISEFIDLLELNWDYFQQLGREGLCIPNEKHMIVAHKSFAVSNCIHVDIDRQTMFTIYKRISDSSNVLQNDNNLERNSISLNWVSLAPYINNLEYFNEKYTFKGEQHLYDDEFDFILSLSVSNEFFKSIIKMQAELLKKETQFFCFECKPKNIVHYKELHNLELKQIMNDMQNLGVLKS